jgi:hypothetical protein
LISREGHEGTRRREEDKNENYKLQITNYKQITTPKLQITNGRGEKFFAPTSGRKKCRGSIFND